MAKSRAEKELEEFDLFIGQNCFRLHLPTYEFEKIKCWSEPPISSMATKPQSFALSDQIQMIEDTFLNQIENLREDQDV